MASEVAERTGPCIVCGCQTSHRSHGGTGRSRYSHWRCPPDAHDQCADRRDMRRARPKHRNKAIDDGLSLLAVLTPDQINRLSAEPHTDE